MKIEMVNPNSLVTVLHSGGVVFAAGGTGAGWFYNDSQIARLNEIRSMQDRGMRLASIAKVLNVDVEVTENLEERDIPL